MGRLFAFGCSFTKYAWSTWADILRFNFSEYYNDGIPGAGNLRIFIKFIERLSVSKISKNDTVVIMWTNVAREDRFLNNSWVSVGNIYSQSFYEKNFIEKYCDIQGFFERDIPLIYAVKNILDGIGCKYHMLSMVDIQNIEQYKIEKLSENKFQHLEEKYKDVLSIIKPSVHNIIFNYDYNSRPIPGFENRFDVHPLPLEHLEYIEKVLPEYFIEDSVRNLLLVENEQVLKNIKPWRPDFY